jgi:hypothetical protein
MRNTIVIAVISLLIISCTKNKFQSTPQLKYKSVNTKELHSGESIQFRLSYTDAEGDLQDSMYIEKVGINCTQSSYKEYWTLPAFPVVKNSEGEIIVSYTYGTSGPYLQYSIHSARIRMIFAISALCCRTRQSIKAIR